MDDEEEAPADERTYSNKVRLHTYIRPDTERIRDAVFPVPECTPKR